MPKDTMELDCRGYDSSSSFDQDMHNFLCGFSSKAYLAESDDENEDDGGGWQEVTRKKQKRNPSKKIEVKSVKVTPEMIKMFSETYMKVFHAFTGIKFEFSLTKDTYKYVSMLPPARERNRVLSTLFEYRPRIVDCTAGSGADTISFLLDLDPLLVVACSRSCADGVSHGQEYDNSLRESQVLQKNVNNFVSAFKSHMRDQADSPCDIKVKHLHAHSYIQSLPDGTEFDMLYFDPSWDDDHDGTKRQYEMSPPELFKHLEENFWGPIKRKNITVGCYVIKTRWEWRDVQQFLPDIKKSFIARYSIRAQQFRANLEKPGMYGERKGVFHYMVLVHRDYQTINFHNGQAYWDIVRNEQDVWIDTSTQTGMVRPNFSNIKKKLQYKTSDPKDSAHFMHITAVRHGKPVKKKYVERHTKHESTYKPFKPEDYEPDQV